MEFCQLQLNYMDWHFQNAQEKVSVLQKAGIPVWVMEPLRGGKLAKASDELEAALQSMRPQETCGMERTHSPAMACAAYFKPFTSAWVQGTGP